MPDFPRYQSKGDLTTQTPSTQAPLDTSGQVLEQASKVGQTVQDVTLKWSNAVDTMQKTVATANFEKGLADIHARAQNDPNYNNSDQYLKEIEKLKNDNLQGFSSVTAQTEMGIELGYKATVGQIQVNNLYKKKQIEVNQASVLDLIKTQTDNPAPDSFQTIQDILYGKGGDMNNVTGGQVGHGLIARDDAFKLLEKASVDLGVNRVYNDLNNAQTPSQVDEIKKNVRSGAYDIPGITLSAKEKSQLITAADQYKTKTLKESHLEQMKTFNATEGQLAGQMANGKFTINALESAKGSVSDEFYQVAKDSSMQSFGNLDANKYIQLVTDFGKLSSDSVDAQGNIDTASKNKALMKFRIDVMANKSKLDETNFNKLLSWTDPNFIAEIKPKANYLQAGIEFIKNHFGNILDASRTNPAEQGIVMGEFMTQALAPTIQGGGVLKVARDIVKENTFKNNPTLTGQEDVTNSIVNQATGIRQVYNGSSNVKADRKITPPETPAKTYTKSDLQFTADKYGITVDEVLKKLSSKNNGK